MIQPIILGLKESIVQVQEGKTCFKGISLRKKDERRGGRGREGGAGGKEGNKGGGGGRKGEKRKTEGKKKEKKRKKN